MSTTLSVVHVLMADNDHLLDSGLDIATTSSTLLSTTSSQLSRWAGLDPLLLDFWSAFPCPPPWNTALLFRVNWTACVGQAVGQRLQWFLADRCNIPIDGSLDPGEEPPGGFPGGDGEGGVEDQIADGARELCDMSCKILVSILSVLVVVGVIVAGIFILHRRRSQRKDQRGGQATGASGSDRRTHYTGIHYASANVINRENERPLPPCPEGEKGMPRQLQAYVYNPRDNDLGPPDLRFHLHLCPMNRRAAYRVMEPSNSSSANSETSHVYDYISDTESVRWRGGGVGARGPSMSDYYCTCDAQHSTSDGSATVVGGDYNIVDGSVPFQQRQSEGYYSDHDHSRPSGDPLHPHSLDHDPKSRNVVPIMGPVLGPANQARHQPFVPHIPGKIFNTENPPPPYEEYDANAHPGDIHQLRLPFQNNPSDSRGIVDPRVHPSSRQLSYTNVDPRGVPDPKHFAQPGWRVDNVDGDAFEGLDGNANMPITFRDNFALDQVSGPPLTRQSRDLGESGILELENEDIDEGLHANEDADEGGKRANALALHPDYFADYFDHRGSTSA